MGAAALLTSACGPVRVGQPATYSPPPEGIDDLYRADLLKALAPVAAQAERLRGAAGPVGALGTQLHSACTAQHAALLTGAEAQRSADASASASPSATASAGAPDVPALVRSVQALLTLGTAACVQCSGSFARVVAAICAHQVWAATRAAHLAGGSVAAPTVPAAASIRPTRTVPASDPPSVAAQVDYQNELTHTQGDEWYLGYVLEVLAARATDAAARKRLLSAAISHRARAEELARWAQAASITSAVRQPVYPLPHGGADASELAGLPSHIARSLLPDWVAMVGAVPFEHRAYCVSVALTEAQGLSTAVTSLPALPSLDVGTH